jgi:ABC-type nitrate/sulfonate/bicarbonate transport system permease component
MSDHLASDRFMSARVLSRAIGFASLATVLVVWELAARHRLVNPVLMPPPSAIAAALRSMIASGDILPPILHTVALFAVGYALACVLGIAIGLWMGRSSFAYGLLEPLVELLRPLPKSALVPALFLFLGIGMTTMITVVVFAALFPVLINTFQGVRGIDPVLLDTARTFRCGRWRIAWSVILPAALPSILTGMKVALSLGLVLAILAEMLAGLNGLGFVILDAQRSFQTSNMYAWIVIVAALGAVLSLAFDKIERMVVPWRGNEFD